jgi:hypothetical protein
MAQILLKNGLQANVSTAIARKGEALIALDTGKLYIGTNDGGGSTGTTDKIQITDVVFVTNFASLPAIGATDKLYISKADKQSYFWNGTSYDSMTVDITSLILDTAVAGDKTHTYSADKIIALLLGKADKVIGATANDVAILDVNGNLVDSGKKLADYVTLVGVETITNKVINADNNTITNLEADNFKTGVIDTDVNLTANSDTKISSQKAIKAYIDAIASAVVGGLKYKGVLDASALGTQLDNAKQGCFYKVSVAGTILTSLALNVGDMVIVNKNLTGSPTLADLDVIDNTESADILRIGNISTNADFTVDGTKLTDRATIKTYVTNAISVIDGGTF